MRRVVAMAAAIGAAAGLSGCGVVGGGGGTYTITAEFERAVGLYEQSRVKVMGADAGTVTSVEIDGELVIVEMAIDDDVPLPADAVATIAPLTLIGERNVVIDPWQPGDDRLQDGDVLRWSADPALSQTRIPVEPDEILQSLTDLAESIDPAAVGDLLESGAEAIDGQGATIGAALEGTAAVTASLADQDEQLLEAARNLTTLATALNSRGVQLGQLVQNLSSASRVLADERDSIAAFLQGMVDLAGAGTPLLDAYGNVLPADIAALADLALVLESNLGSLLPLVAAFPTIGEELVDAYDPVRQTLVLNISLTPIAQQALSPLLDTLGLTLCDLSAIDLLGDFTC